MLFVAAGFFYLAFSHGGWWWLLLYPGIGQIITSLGYLYLGAGVFGKRKDGLIPLWSILLNGPYLFYYNALWISLRLLRIKNSFDPIDDSLWLGRRPLAGELPQGVKWVIDLTAEMPRKSGVIDDEHYLCVPILDVSILPPAQILELAKKVAALDGPALVHCAEGRGRSATLMAAILMVRKSAPSAQQAIDLLKTKRSGIKINRRQRACLNEVEKLLGS